MENDDAQYKKELEEARQTGDLTVVAAVQAKWTVRGTIAGDSRFNGADLKNFEKIAEKADKLSPGEKLEFYLRLGAEVFKGKNGDGKNTREFLANLANSPRAIQRMGRWSSTLTGGGRRAMGRLAATSALAGLSRLAGNRSRLAFDYPKACIQGRPCLVPPERRSGGQDNTLGIQLGLTASGAYLKSYGDLVNQVAPALLLAAKFTDKGIKLDAAYASIQTSAALAKDIDKVTEAAGFIVNAVELIGTWKDIRGTGMPPEEKLAAWTMEFWGTAASTGVEMAAGVYATMLTGGNFWAGGAVTTAASAIINESKDFITDGIKDRMGWDYGWRTAEPI